MLYWLQSEPRCTPDLHLLRRTDLKPAAFKVQAELHWLSRPDAPLVCRREVCYVCRCKCVRSVETKLDERHRTLHWALSGGIKCGCHFCITAHTPALFQCPPANTMSSYDDGPGTPGNAESGSSQVFSAVLTSLFSWLTQRKLLSVGVHQQLWCGWSEAWWQTDGNKMCSLVLTDPLNLCLDYLS